MLAGQTRGQLWAFMLENSLPVVTIFGSSGGYKTNGRDPYQWWVKHTPAAAPVLSYPWEVPTYIGRLIQAVLEKGGMDQVIYYVGVQPDTAVCLFLARTITVEHLHRSRVIQGRLVIPGLTFGVSVVSLIVSPEEGYQEGVYDLWDDLL